MRRHSLIVLVAAGLGLLSGAGGVGARPAQLVSRAHAAATVKLLVLRRSDGETAALAPVVIHGLTFPFLIDTGATRSVVDLALVKKLHLRRVGGLIRVAGVGCISTARNVRLSNWRIGSQTLPAVTVTSTRIAGANGHAFGLLGSDVLSRFGSATINYAHATLT